MKVEKNLTCANINQNLLNIKYAVRGAIPERAIQIEQELEMGVNKPFKRVIRANIGDGHALGQKPITFIRQVLALVACPHLESTLDVPDDVRLRAREILLDCLEGSVGAFSPIAGLRLVRTRVAQYIEARDGVPTAADDIYLGSGASDLIKAVFNMFVNDDSGVPSAVMVPVPQYPLFSGLLSELGLRQADYYLDEENDWAISVQELKRCWIKASLQSNVRALVVINPGNPTGVVMSRENIELIIKFAYENNIFLIADEVYEKTAVNKPFYSFKKVMHEMGAPYSFMELASFASCSKGWAAEAGLRSGYVELVRVAPAVMAAFSTARSLMQCPSVLGQCVMDCVMKPPRLGDPSYVQFLKEIEQFHQILTERIHIAYEVFNSIPGYSCNRIDGAMFAFPRVELPAHAQEAATQVGLSPDEFYCLRLLEETGVCVVPGSGFGQLPGTFHFRTTVLHGPEEFQHMLHSIRTFHINFVHKYS